MCIYGFTGLHCKLRALLEHQNVEAKIWLNLRSYFQSWGDPEEEPLLDNLVPFSLIEVGDALDADLLLIKDSIVDLRMAPTPCFLNVHKVDLSDVEDLYSYREEPPFDPQEYDFFIEAFLFNFNAHSIFILAKYYTCLQQSLFDILWCLQCYLWGEYLHFIFIFLRELAFHWRWTFQFQLTFKFRSHLNLFVIHNYCLKKYQINSLSISKLVAVLQGNKRFFDDER